VRQHGSSEQLRMADCGLRSRGSMGFGGAKRTSSGAAPLHRCTVRLSFLD
jgi:alpha-D-ribose 1-methylphosphonate 5-triphosphate synthase subunit PhnG